MPFTAGVLNRNGSSQQEELLRRITPRQQITHRGPISIAGLETRETTRTSPAAALQHLRETCGYLVCWVGRLDNLADCIGLQESSAQTFEEAILASYIRWGSTGFSRLIGEFAFSLWDPIQWKLVLAVDALGRVPLYYHVSATYAAWAPRARLLAKAIHAVPEVNEDYVADFLSNRPSIESPFRGVLRVPPGSSVVVTGDRTDSEGYWSPNPAHEIRYQHDHEYEEHFETLFNQAVRCRLESDRPTACELSGGVDSSSVVCAANKIVASHPQHSGLLLISYIYSQSPSSDESQYINVLESQLRWPALTFDESKWPILKPPGAECAFDEPTSQLLFLCRQDGVAQAMSERGASVLLNGIGGDQLFWSEPPPALPLADLLHERRLLKLHRSCLDWSRTLEWSYVRTLCRGAVWPLLRRNWRARLQRANPVAEWLCPSFVRRSQLADRMLGYDDDVGFLRPSQRAQYGMIRQTMRPYALQRVTTGGLVDIRYPYLDRRVVEFALALPLEQTIRLGETRSIVRRSFQGILPERIRTRTTKAGPSEAFLRALTRERAWVDELFTNARTVELGYVDAAVIQVTLQRARHGLLTNTVQLMKTLALEIWLRSLV